MKDLRNQAVNAQAKHREHPDTFWVPSLASLAALKATDFVKIAVSGERFWVQLTAVDGHTLTGRINNDLVFTDQHGLADTDEVLFNTCHVHDILTEGDDHETHRPH